MKNICFDMLSVFTLGGTLVRNKPIISMMVDFKKMLDNIDAKSMVHRDLLRQFGRTRAEANRNEVKAVVSLISQKVKVSHLPVDPVAKSVAPFMIEHINSCETCKNSSEEIPHTYAKIVNDTYHNEIFTSGFKKDLITAFGKVRSGSITPVPAGIKEAWAEALWKICSGNKGMNEQETSFYNLFKDHTKYERILLLLMNNAVQTNLEKLGFSLTENLPFLQRDESEATINISVIYKITTSDTSIKSRGMGTKKGIQILDTARAENLACSLLFAECFFSEVGFRVTTKDDKYVQSAYFGEKMLLPNIPNNSQSYCLYEFNLKP